MENDEKFDMKSFFSPDVAHAPVYIWVWNDICTCEIIDSQLAEMCNLGIRAFYILPEPKNFRPDIMRYTIGYQAVLGINIFNPFNFPLGRKGQLLAQELPIFTEGQPYYSYFGQFNRYIERLFYVSALGKKSLPNRTLLSRSRFLGWFKN